MKKILLTGCCLALSSIVLLAQDTYPVPEYANEIYLVKKDPGITLLRLEKGSSKQEMKMKMMGMGGMDQGYELEGDRSPVRLQGGSNLVFLLYTGSAGTSTAQSDSMMKANGMDPKTISEAMSMFTDPTKTTSLYDARPEKGKRRILLQSMGLLGKSKKTATKYTVSIKKIQDGYYEMMVDKTLPRGEYSFVLMSMSMDQSFSLFAFAVE
ncbi:MAG: hypothetical protein H7Y01_05475 [Ferruginibacter sp.]|nr:hypothetical protein [Chitinophagaceae bacterium]